MKGSGDEEFHEIHKKAEDTANRLNGPVQELRTQKLSCNVEGKTPEKLYRWTMFEKMTCCTTKVIFWMQSGSFGLFNGKPQPLKSLVML